MLIKTAVVGLGWWGRHIVNTLHGKNDKIDLTTAVDVSLKSIADFCANRNIRMVSDFEEVLIDPEIDAIIIATPHSFHEKQIIASAQAGKHVFCEKPLALTFESALRSVEACDASGVILGIGHERRFEPAMQEISRLVRQGELGTIMHVEANFSHDKLANLDPKNWRVSHIESPAAAMTATGIHITDAYINMFGSVEKVFATTSTRNPANTNGDILNLNVRFKSGVTGTFNSVLETPLYIRFAVFGSKAWLEARDYTHPSEIGTTDFFISHREGEVAQTVFQDVDTVKLNFEAWADAISGVTDYPINREQKLENIAVFEAICRSVKTGMPIDL